MMPTVVSAGRGGWGPRLPPPDQAPEIVVAAVDVDVAVGGEGDEASVGARTGGTLRR